MESWEIWAYRLWTKRMKCCGGTNARSMSTSATTICFASFLNFSKAAVASATTYVNYKLNRSFMRSLKNAWGLPLSWKEDISPDPVYHLQLLRQYQKVPGAPIRKFSKAASGVGKSNKWQRLMMHASKKAVRWLIHALYRKQIFTGIKG